MRFMLLLVLAAAFAASPALAKTRVGHARATAPKSMGTFGDWQSATHTEGGQTICYAFSRPQSSTPTISGRGDVVITVTERARLRDTVALSAGFTYPSGAAAIVQVGTQKFPFYTSGRSAFARDGAAVIAAFQQGDAAVAISSAPRDRTVTDQFSLTGFSAAMKSVLAACPGSR